MKSHHSIPEKTRWLRFRIAAATSLPGDAGVNPSPEPERAVALATSSRPSLSIREKRNA
jgi:hypothetical protein